MRAAFLGTGNMGSALARAACRGVGADQVILANRTMEKAQRLAKELGCEVASDNIQAAQQASYLFLCVKPHLLKEVIGELCPVLEEASEAGQPKVLVSIAAGVTLDALRSYLPLGATDTPVLRIMPNTCVEIGQGMLALSVPAHHDPKHITEVKELLSAAGRLEVIPEESMDAFTAVAGCGPAFIYPLIEAMADGGVQVGLSRGQAMTYAAQTVLGAAAMVLETHQHPGQLKDAVCSPGGSTIAGVAALEQGGFRATAMAAVVAAYQRNGQLGKE